MQKYISILTYFNAKPDKDNMLQTSSYVTMDDIHDSVIYQGVTEKGLNPDKEVKHFIIKAKQFAINRHNNLKRQLALLKNAPPAVKDSPFDMNILDGFTDDEKTLILERLAGKGMNKSVLSRRVYENALSDIKQKLRNKFPSMRG